jgi:hypothetical protein
MVTRSTPYQNQTSPLVLPATPNERKETQSWLYCFARSTPKHSYVGPLQGLADSAYYTALEHHHRQEQDNTESAAAA